MSQTMSRGKQQVLYTYLPMNTIDFQGGGIARIRHIRGSHPNNINPRFVVERVREDAEAWGESFRPALRDDTLQNTDRFVLIDPSEVIAELYPKVFWCDKCGRIYDMSTQNKIPRSGACHKCNGGRLSQLRFVIVHRCGEIQPLTSPICQQCNGRSGHMALITYGSERVSEFRWVCRRCNTTAGGVFGGLCHACEWPGETNEEQQNLRRMRVLVHRAGPTFYPRSVTLLNIPQQRLDGFFALEGTWPSLAAAKFFGLPEIASHRLEDMRPVTGGGESEQAGLTGKDLDQLMARQASGELTPEQMVQEMHLLRNQRTQEQQTNSPQGIAERLVERSGVAADMWDRAGQEMLEGVLPLETGKPRSLLNANDAESQRIARYAEAQQTASLLGLTGLTLLDDFPIVQGTYGYTRLEPGPDQTRLNPFPIQPNTGGKIPIFVDSIRADALMLKLDPDRVHRWLERNGYMPSLPNGTYTELTKRAYFVQLFDGVSLKQTLPDGQSRMVFTLLHTLSHLIVRQAGLLCGLDRTSLSEYLLPRALTAFLYCNHRFGATIGALTSLFEQTLVEWLDAIRDAYRCVYDPVCRERDGACHACLHLSETSCGYFNLNLGRAFLFGGDDQITKRRLIGYFDPTLEEASEPTNENESATFVITLPEEYRAELAYRANARTTHCSCPTHSRGTSFARPRSPVYGSKCAVGRYQPRHGPMWGTGKRYSYRLGQYP